VDDSHLRGLLLPLLVGDLLVAVALAHAALALPHGARRQKVQTRLFDQSINFPVQRPEVAKVLPRVLPDVRGLDRRHFLPRHLDDHRHRYRTN